MNTSPRYLTTILKASFSGPDMALKQFERVKRIAELCAFGPMVQKILFEKFGEDLGGIISSFLFR